MDKAKYVQMSGHSNMPRKSLILSSSEVLELITPIVFIWRRGDTVLAILGSKVGMGRFSKGLDDVIKGFDFEAGDTLELVWPENAENIGVIAKELEAELSPIKKLNAPNTGIHLETLAEIRERRQQELLEAKYRKEFVDKLVDEELPLARWKKQ